ncbi:MAG: ABC transporter substrate-binding protein, partial [Acidimicrobiia bacterium]|nr:ABC transporter substrate-binding protein [Acidimicrobiia bacterium]
MTVRPTHRSARWLLLALVASLLFASCGTTTEEPFASNPTTDGGGGGGGATTTAPSPDPACDTNAPERSLAPEGPLPPPGQMPAGSTMAEIQAKGKLVAGVGADTLLFGFLNPKSGDIEG